VELAAVQSADGVYASRCPLMRTAATLLRYLLLRSLTRLCRCSLCLIS
jgi:hypothetical protein